MIILLASTFSAQGITLTVAEHGNYEEKLERVWSSIIEFINPSLSVSERLIVDQVEIYVSKSNDIIVQAEKVVNENNGSIDRIVKISTGFIALLDTVHQTYVHQEYLDAGPCYSAYSFFLREKFSSGRRSLRVISEPEQIKYCECASFSSTALMQNSDVRKMLAGGVEAILLFTYLHELAHHVKGHLNEPADSSFEDEADDWALEKALRSGYPIESAAPLLLWFFDTEASSTANAASHPSADVRLDNFLNRLIKRAENPKIPFRFGEEWREWALSAFQEFRSYIIEVRAFRPSKSSTSCPAHQQIMDYTPFLHRYFESPGAITGHN